jgi:vacuolar-type H+-ATPase subunit I/STV1
MTTPDRRLESITPEDELHFKLLHELSEGKRNDRHLQVLFDLNKRFESVKSVAKEIVELSKEWGKIHKEKDALSDPDLTKAINEYARKVVSLEDDLLELEASEIEVEKNGGKNSKQK